ncbi:MAG: restriction endonuclease [Chloroflexales bacterium]|jgi:Restriction endonuclease
MSVDTTPEQRGEKNPGLPQPSLIQRAITSLSQVRWGETLLIALAMSVAWCGLFLANGIVQILAGVVPVMAGLYLGRRIKDNYLAHGLVLGFAGFLFGLIAVAAYGYLGSLGIVLMPMLPIADKTTEQATFGSLLLYYCTYSIFAIIPFPAFGTVMAGRTEQRNRDLSKEVEDRGGRLERPGVIRTLDDLRGLSLPQLGSYVSAVYKKKGFEFKDYRFTDKDKHLDIEMTYNGELYMMRLSVADKVRPGTLESLIQDMRRREITKGLVITSTEFTPDTLKAASSKRTIVTIDGQTLFDIAES